MTPSPSAHDPFPAPVAALAPPPSRPEPEPADPAALADEAAWAEVLAAWGDEEAHRAYLGRFADLDGLAAAGRRYRAVLAERPHDPVAARFRDEVLRRAVARGLASLPRSEAVPGRARLAFRVAAGVVIGGLLLAAGMMVARALPLLAGGAHP